MHHIVKYTIVRLYCLVSCAFKVRKKQLLHSELMQNYSEKQRTVQQFMNPLAGSAQPPVVAQVTTPYLPNYRGINFEIRPIGPFIFKSKRKLGLGFTFTTVDLEYIHYFVLIQ